MSDAKAHDSRADKDPRSTRTDPVTFIKQVVAELRKVVWPTQKQLGNYFVIVLFFVLVMMTIVSGLDLLFGRLAFWMFTSGSN